MFVVNNIKSIACLLFFVTPKPSQPSLKGLPSTVPTDFVTHLFWALTVTVGSVWRRLIRPYRRPPFCFALLVDPQVADEAKSTLATFLLNMKPCCLDKAFTGPFRSKVTSPDDILSENGIGYQILQGTFCSKNHNIQVETNFGRASSMRQTNRGRSDRSHNMICKHLLAEIQHAHRRARARQTQPHHVIRSANPDHAQQLHVDDVGLQSIDDDSCLF